MTAPGASTPGYVKDPDGHLWKVSWNAEAEQPSTPQRAVALSSQALFGRLNENRRIVQSVPRKGVNGSYARPQSNL